MIRQFVQILSEKLEPRRISDIEKRMRQLKIELHQSCDEPKTLSHYTTAHKDSMCLHTAFCCLYNILDIRISKAVKENMARRIYNQEQSCFYSEKACTVI